MTRTRTDTVTFQRPFRLSGLDGLLPPGTYSIEVDEERVEGVSFPVFRRVQTLFHIPATAERPGLTETAVIDPHDLAAALESDAAGAWSPAAEAAP